MWPPKGPIYEVICEVYLTYEGSRQKSQNPLCEVYFTEVALEISPVIKLQESFKTDLRRSNQHNSFTHISKQYYIKSQIHLKSSHAYNENTSEIDRVNSCWERRHKKDKNIPKTKNLNNLFQSLRRNGSCQRFCQLNIQNKHVNK